MMGFQPIDTIQNPHPLQVLLTHQLFEQHGHIQIHIVREQTKNAELGSKNFFLKEHSDEEAEFGGTMSLDRVGQPFGVQRCARRQESLYDRPQGFFSLFVLWPQSQLPDFLDFPPNSHCRLLFLGSPFPYFILPHIAL